jgi:hypothetical protein
LWIVGLAAAAPDAAGPSKLLPPLSCKATTRTWPPPGLTSPWVAAVDGTGAQYGGALASNGERVFAGLSNQLGTLIVGGKSVGDKSIFRGYVVALGKDGRAATSYTPTSEGVPTAIDEIALAPDRSLIVLSWWTTAGRCDRPCRLLGRMLAGAPDGFAIQKIDPRSMKPRWTRMFTGPRAGFGLAVDAKGMVFVAAWASDDVRSLDFDVGVPAAQSDGGEDLLFAFTPDGRLAWLRHARTRPRAVAPRHQLLVDRRGQLLTFTPIPTSPGLVARIDTRGGSSGVIGRPSTSPAAPDGGVYGRLMAEDPDGNLAVLGIAQGATTLEGVPLGVPSQDTPFLASFTRDGELRYARPLVDCGDAQFEAIAALGNDRVVLTADSAKFGVMLGVFPRSGEPITFRGELADMQLDALARSAPNAFLVVGSMQTSMRSDYRLLAQQFAISAARH